jgi:MATE family multidrug resistance protein
MEVEQLEPQSWWSRPAGVREVLQIALPMVVTTLTWTLMNFIDSAILMRVSGTAMSAAYSAGIIWFAVLSLFYGMCSYGNTFVAQFYGDGQPQRIGPVVWQGVWLAAAFVPIIPVAQALAPQLFAWFGHEGEFAQLETLFFQVLCYGAPGMLAAQSLECMYGGRGKTWVVMLVDSAAVLINLALACVLVLGWGGVESWGVAGAAWATVLAQWCRSGMYAWLVLARANRRQYRTTEFQLDRDLLRRMVRYGGPSGVQMMVDVGGFAVFMLLVARLGLAEAEATSLAFRISQVAFMPVWGFGMATAVLVGQKLGEDRPDLAQRAARTTLTISLLYMGAMSVTFVTAPWLFLQGFFAEHPAKAIDSTAAALTVQLMRFVAAYNMLDAAVIIFVSVLRGAGDTKFVMKVSSLMASLLAAGTAAGVSWMDMNVYGAWWYITVWVWALGVIYVVRYRSGKWKTMRVIDQVHHGHGHALPAVDGQRDALRGRAAQAVQAVAE